jgi:hypothetical protein
MSETKKTKAVTVEQEAAAPSLLDQILDGMETRVRETMALVKPIEINTFADLQKWAQMAAKSKMVPKDYIDNPDAIMIAVDMGSELGLRRMQSLQNIAVINGRPSVWGDALWALILSQPTLENVREFYEGEGDNRVAVCQIKRRNKELVERRFSVADAKQAGLWKTGPKTQKKGRDGTYEVDSGPWWSYPDRMMQMRARGFAARDAYADALKGLITAEEAMDIPVDMPGPVLSPWTESGARRGQHSFGAAAPESPALERTLQQRASDAAERILEAAPTIEALTKLETRIQPLLADLEGPEPDLKAQLVQMLAERRAAIDAAGEVV